MSAPMFNLPVGVLVVAIIALVWALLRSPPQLELVLSTHGCRQGAVFHDWCWGDHGGYPRGAQDLRVGKQAGQHIEYTNNQQMQQQQHLCKTSSNDGWSSLQATHVVLMQGSLARTCQACVSY